jgi:phosphonate degradation associated HDIG domain protein
MRKTLSPETIVSEIFDLYDKHGDEDYIGEPVSQLEHMSQAASLAEKEGYDDEVVLAAFFHDLGHLLEAEQPAESMDGFGNVDHETLGADYLRKCGFSERLAMLVESHVVAKRYLTFKYPSYYDKLSLASKATLEFQGGPMNAIEAYAFEQDPDVELIVRLRHWDDSAKEIRVGVNNLQYLRLMAVSHLNNNF